MKVFALLSMLSVAGAATIDCFTAITGTAGAAYTPPAPVATFTAANLGIVVQATCTLAVSGTGGSTLEIDIQSAPTNSIAKKAAIATGTTEVITAPLAIYDGINDVTITSSASGNANPAFSLSCKCTPLEDLVAAAAASGPAAAAADCISGTSTVDVLNKGTMEVQDLEVGDQVLTTNGYESVYAFAHRDLAAKDHVYSQIHFEGMSKPFEATARHLVYTTGKANPVTVDSLTLEDSLVGSNGESLKINKIKEVTRDGLFAPLTKSGNLLVDGIKISSYASLQAGQNEFAEFANGMTLPISQATGIHMFLAPLRMLCMSGLSTSVCDPSTYNENGMPQLVSFGINLASTADQQSLFVQFLMLAVVLAIFVPLYALESLVGATVAPAAIALGAGAFAYRNQMTKVKTV